jgi:deazaflavin-dependent oxidoreductase (nitroreductase family)
MSADGIPRFDPERDRGTAARLLQLVLASAPLRRLISYVAQHYADAFLHWLARSRVGGHLPLPFASMTTTGARSGQPRTTAVLYFNDAEDLILVASNFGGDRHPSWYYNLRANPGVSLVRARHSGTYTATEVTDEGERERLLARSVRVHRGYADYMERTAQIGRRIPIMRLRPTA